ncbi:D-amino-acid transaminase [Azorhizobium oxalatiphilum]|uniref:Probable branched-chain-amino-acid aminotransferase n=1 Tax=Azorhizobium oxalatiphilum TaxID=980631 RepID=A0A917BZ99_9HYPH|nr:D-amino-acid transaminase [Azorhizobium oxalatiphilum]GGF62803.1 D-amino-acid transaminase [Azorhizobium oxalatiphilum]
MDRIAYVNGDFVPLSEARISPLDRGFLFADGIYEVSAVLDGKLVDNDSHLARLKRSVGEIALDLPVTLEELVELERELVRRNNLTEGVVYMQVTRGVADRDFTFPKDAKPTLFMFTQEKNILGSKAAETGVRVKSVPDLRWARRDIKSVALLAQVLAKQAAAEAGCAEAWMIQDGFITEGGSSSAFIITAGDVVVTRPNSTAVLPGCTRRALLALAAEGAITVEERLFTLDEALAAKEAFLASASSFVQPVVAIDDKPIGDGTPGPLSRRLRELYIAFARETAV